MPYQLDYDFRRSDIAVQSSIFIRVFWCEFNASVLLVSCLDLHTNCRFFRTCTSFFVQRVELSLARAERIYRLQVEDWEVPTPPLQDG